MNSEFPIRPWSEKDFTDVRKLLSITWFETYKFIPENDLLNYLNNFYSFEKLEELYRNKNAYCFSVEFENQLIGWMKLIDNKSEGKFYVSSLYILPNFQGLGIGKKLMLLAEQKAAELGHNDLWIGVMEKNLPTLKWYKKLGFIFIKEEPFAMSETSVNHYIGFKSIKT